MSKRFRTIGSRLKRRCTIVTSLVALVALIVGTTTASGELLPPLIDLGATPGSEVAPVFRVYGEAAGDWLGSRFGAGTAFGDVNGDGFDDLIVGARMADAPGGVDAGAAYVVYGSADRPVSQLNLALGMVATSSTCVLGDNAGDEMGFSVASGDVNDDGFDDIIIGAWKADVLASVDAGQVYVVFGSPSLPGRIIDLNDPVGTHGEIRVWGASAGDWCGFGLTSGDVNGDGVDDIIIGAYYVNLPVGDNAGEVYVIYGDPSLASMTIDLYDRPGTYGETRIRGSMFESAIGYTLAVGDMDGDGYGDIMIGAGLASPPGLIRAGAAYVVYGATSLPGTIVDLSQEPSVYGGTRIYGAHNRDFLGTSIAAGDVNGNGYDDLVIGANYADPGGRDRAGAMYVIYGGPGLRESTIDLAASNGDAVTHIYGDGEIGHLGSSAACYDVNGDGFDDIIGGAYYWDNTPRVEPGEVHVIYGGLGLPGATVDLSLDQGDVIVLGDTSNELFGVFGEGTGDVDRDGWPDILSTARLGDNPTLPADNDSGYAAVVFGDGATTEATKKRFIKAGDAPAMDFGPVVRCSLDYGDGLAVSADDVRISRVPPTEPPYFRTVLPVCWGITSSRVHALPYDMTFRYTDGELGLVDETSLVVFAASIWDPDKWWRAGIGQAVDAHRNRIEVTGIDGMSVFAVVDVSTRLDSALLDFLLGQGALTAEEQARADANADGVLSIADLTWILSEGR